MKSHIDDSVIACDEIIDTLETVWINSTYKKQHIKWIVIFFTPFY